ncbi:MAG: AlpA family transcriptional regulator [Methylovulum sp.]|nr:AlpA family transcriptional regulator [Methylovulum sp.]
MTTQSTPQPCHLSELALLRLTQIIGNLKANPSIPALIPVGRTTFLNGVKSGKYLRAEDIPALIESIGHAANVASGNDSSPGFSSKTQHRKVISLSATIKKTELSRSTIDNLLKKGEFPQPIKLSSRTIGFIESEIDQWLADKATRNGMETRHYQTNPKSCRLSTLFNMLYKIMIMINLFIEWFDDDGE